MCSKVGLSSKCLSAHLGLRKIKFQTFVKREETKHAHLHKYVSFKKDLGSGHVVDLGIKWATSGGHKVLTFTIFRGISCIVFF